MIAYRLASPADRAFIVSGWSCSYKESHSAGMIADERWAPVMHVEINATLDRPDVSTIVAYDPDEAPGLADLFGFIVADPNIPIVWYCYVKQAYRLLGIARGLYAAMGIDPMRPHYWVCKTADAARLKASLRVPFGNHEPGFGRLSPGRIRRQRYQPIPVTVLRSSK